MPKANRSTSYDVAARAGVSQATVSLVLTGNPTARIGAATRERVLQAAAELGYRPNLLARGLVSRRSFSIGVVVPSLTDPFYTDVVAGVQRVASAEGFVVLLCETAQQPVAQQVELLKGWLVDGLIIDAVGVAALPEELLAELNVVLIDEPSTRWPWVASDAVQGGRIAAEHLIELGHRRIAYAGPASELHAFHMRERGFIQAVRGAGLSISSEYLRRVAPTAAGGQQAVRALLGVTPRPSAVCFANDLLALGALKACAAARVLVPAEMSLIGCDDIEMARLVTPELTTVAVPAKEMGARAARLVIERVAGDERARKAPRPLPVKLQVRGTTARVAEAA